MNVKIDSFSVLLPLSHVISYPSDCNGKLLLVSDTTGEIVSQKNGYYHKEDNNGVTFRVNKKVLPTGIECLQFVVTSKMLCSSYFDGINSTNIDLITSYVSTFGVVLPQNWLSLSHIYDIDLCNDYYFHDDDFLSDSSIYDNHPLIKKFYLPFGYNNKKMLVGYQFGTRQTGSITNPFVKFYTKKYEPKTLHFCMVHDLTSLLSLTDNSLLRRCEVTIKNKHHFDSIMVANKHCGSPIDLFFDKDLRTSVFSFLLNKLVVSEKKLKKNTTPYSLSSSDYLLYSICSEFTNFSHGSDLSQINLFLDNLFYGTDFDTRKKARIKAKFREILTFI